MLAVWLLLLSATTLVTAGTLYGDSVEVGGLRVAVLASPPDQRAVTVRLTASRDELGALDGAIRPVLTDAFGDVGGDVALTARSGSLKPAGPPTDDAGQRLTMLGSYDQIDRHASLVGGRWAQPDATPVEATLSEGAAAALGLAVGDSVALADASDPRADPTVAVIEVQVVGIWRPTAGDAYWLSDALDLEGLSTNGQVTFRGPFIVAAADLGRSDALSTLDVRWRALPDITRLRIDELDPMRARIAALPTEVRVALPDDRYHQVDVALADVLGALDRSFLVSRSGVVLLTLQFAVLAGYAVLLVGGMLAERRRPDVALLRARGASTGHIGSLALGDGLLLTIPATVLAPFLAVGVVMLIGQVGPLATTGIVGSLGVTDGAVTVALVAGLACLLALTLPALGTHSDLARIRAALGRPVAQTLAQRLGIDLVLIVLAVIGLWQLRLYGAPITRDARGSLGVDPLLVAAPAFGLAAGAVLATRFVPRIAEIGERLMRRRPGVVPSLGTRQVARRPLRYTRTALLLMLAGALGTFAVIYEATWTRSQGDQAAYQTAADLRVVPADYPTLPTWAVGPAFRSLPGVTAATPVVRQPLEVGRAVRAGEIVSLDPDQVAATVAFPDDPAGRSTTAALAELASLRPTTGSPEIGGHPLRLAVTIDSAITGDDFILEQPTPPDWPGILVALIVQDADGRLHRFEAEEPARFAEADQLVVVPLTQELGGVVLSPPTPLIVQGVEITVRPPDTGLAYGTVEVRSLSTSESATGDDWAPTAFDPAATDWAMGIDEAVVVHPSDLGRPGHHRDAPGSGDRRKLRRSARCHVRPRAKRHRGRARHRRRCVPPDERRTARRHGRRHVPRAVARGSDRVGHRGVPAARSSRAVRDRRRTDHGAGALRRAPRDHPRDRVVAVRRGRIGRRCCCGRLGGAVRCQGDRPTDRPCALAGERPGGARRGRRTGPRGHRRGGLRDHRIPGRRGHLDARADGRVRIAAGARPVHASAFRMAVARARLPARCRPSHGGRTRPPDGVAGAALRDAR